MNEHDALIERLCSETHPVKRPAAPWLRAAGWMLAALASGFAATRIMPHARPDWSAPGGLWAGSWLLLSLCLATLAIHAAFTLSIAGRRRPHWRRLGAIAAAWLAVGLVDMMPAADPIGRVGDGIYCYTFMLVAGAPMIVLAVAAMRRTRTLYPRASLALAALGIAAATQVLLGFCHPVTVKLIDLLMHLAATGTLVVVTLFCGRRWVSM